MKNCRDCGEPLPIRVGRGRPRDYCVDCRPPDKRRRYQPRQHPTATCRCCGESFAIHPLVKDPSACTSCRPRPSGTPSGTCCRCGKPVWLSRTSLPQGRAKCRPCRRLDAAAQPKVTRDQRSPCVDCSTPSWGTRCRPCADKAKCIRPHGQKAERRHREQAAPGLTSTERARLLATWKKQGRTCTYCAKPATTIDHVLPLIRGGTNYEGNLTPCCRACNSSKSGWMLVEWRTGKRCGPGAAVPWAVIVTPPKPAKPRRTKQTRLDFCAICGEPHSGPRRRYCSQECMLEGNARLNRERYRASVGLPPTPATPTKPRVRRGLAA